MTRHSDAPRGPKLNDGITAVFLAFLLAFLLAGLLDLLF